MQLTPTPYSFADAEKEQKEKGNESSLHIIICRPSLEANRVTTD